MWKTSGHVMCARLRRAWGVIGFWPVFRQLLSCIISVGACSGALFGFRQKWLELHKINRTPVFLKDRLITLHLAQGEHCSPPSLQVTDWRGPWATNPMCSWSWPRFEETIRPDDDPLRTRLLYASTAEHPWVCLYLCLRARKWQEPYYLNMALYFPFCPSERYRSCRQTFHVEHTGSHRPSTDPHSMERNFMGVDRQGQTQDDPLLRLCETVVPVYLSL